MEGIFAGPQLRMFKSSLKIPIEELYPKDEWTWHDAVSRTQSNALKDEVWITR